MSEVNVCSLGVQWKVLQYEEVLTALFIIGSQLEWVSSSCLIMRPFLPLSVLRLSLLSLPVVSLAVAFLSISLTHPACIVEPTAGREGIRDSGR